MLEAIFWVAIFLGVAFLGYKFWECTNARKRDKVETRDTLFPKKGGGSKETPIK